MTAQIEKEHAGNPFHQLNASNLLQKYSEKKKEIMHNLQLLR